MMYQSVLSVLLGAGLLTGCSSSGQNEQTILLQEAASYHRQATEIAVFRQVQKKQ